MDIAGIPEEHMEPRVARIYIPAREATQSAWNNTKTWKIELDNRQRWENPLIGWSSRCVLIQILCYNISSPLICFFLAKNGNTFFFIFSIE